MISTCRTALLILLGALSLPAARAGMEVIAHRGAMMLAPENTLASQRLAYELGADYVEVDVRITRDFVPINLHDHDVDRTTNGTGLVGAMTLAEVKQLDAGYKFHPRFAGERIPTLAEHLEVAKQYNRKLMMDIKGEYLDTVVIDAIRQSGISLNQIAFYTYWDNMALPYTTKLPGVKMVRAPVVPETGATLRPEQVTTAVMDDFRRKKVTTLLFGVGNIAKSELDRFHDAGFEVSSLYSGPTYAFYFQDNGLDSFWTDYTDVTVGGLNRTEQQWNNWAETMGLAPDQKSTWMDPDGDGMTNIIEFAAGTNPLEPGPVPPVKVEPPNMLTWTLDLRENWSQFLTISPQTNFGTTWNPLAASYLNMLSPTRMQLRGPMINGRQFYRLRFDLK